MSFLINTYVLEKNIRAPNSGEGRSDSDDSHDRDECTVLLRSKVSGNCDEIQRLERGATNLAHRHDSGISGQPTRYALRKSTLQGADHRGIFAGELFPLGRTAL
jgi:hypothetical protein